MQYEVELSDEAITGLFRGRVYGRGLKPDGRLGRRFLIATFSAPTWRHAQDEAKALREAHASSRTYVFDAGDTLVPKAMEDPPDLEDDAVEK